MQSYKALAKARRLESDSSNLALHKLRLPQNALVTIARDKLRGAHHKKVFIDKQHYIDKFTLLPVLNKAGDKISIVKKHKDYID